MAAGIRKPVLDKDVPMLGRFSIDMLSVGKSSPMSALAWKQQLSQGSLGRKSGYSAK
jgi:hypothetical protein